VDFNDFPRFYTWKVKHIETWKVITFCVFDARSKTEFTNNSLKTPKLGKLNIDTLITPQGLLIHGKNYFCEYLRENEKIFENILACEYRDPVLLIHEKNRGQKSHATVPLSSFKAVKNKFIKKKSM